MAAGCIVWIVAAGWACAQDIQWEAVPRGSDDALPCSPVIRLNCGQSAAITGAWNSPAAAASPSMALVSSPPIRVAVPQAQAKGFAPIVRAQGPDAVPSLPPPSPPPGSAPLPIENPLFPGQDPYNCAQPLKGTPEGQPPGVGGAWNNMTLVWTSITSPAGGRKALESDHEFDGFISPVTNPFYFEDPRALTEIRPIFMYQTVPDSTPIYSGGDVGFFGLQGRVALTQNFSLVLHKLGGVWQSVGAPVGEFEDNGGFAEIWLGAKYTFLRCKETETIMAGGLIFEIPAGSSEVFQDTGSLSLTPYISFGQGFWETYYGKFHFLNTTGYSLGVDSDRSDHFYTSFHLDFDLFNKHRFYPFLELNYFIYTTSGEAQALSFEGRDMINFGANDVGGNNDLAIATGLRFKFNEHIQLGGAVEFPLLDRKDLMDFRMTFDLILRY
jgi:hypothetical protein